MSSNVSFNNNSLIHIELSSRGQKKASAKTVSRDAQALIFSYLNRVELGKVAPVSKEFKACVDNPKLWVTKSNPQASKADFLNKFESEKQKVILLKEKAAFVVKYGSLETKLISFLSIAFLLQSGNKECRYTTSLILPACLSLWLVTEKKCQKEARIKKHIDVANKQLKLLIEEPSQLKTQTIKDESPEND